MPDAKPSEPVTDPIPLKDLVQAFASTVAATSHNLDQATVDLRNLYQNSGNALLAMMLPPRFTLDEISIDLSFVVISASPDEFSDQLPAESKQVGRATLEDPDTLSTKLAGAAKDDALADAQAKRQRSALRAVATVVFACAQSSLRLWSYRSWASRSSSGTGR